MELGEPVVGVLVGEVSVGLSLDGFGVSTLSFPIVVTGHEGKGGGTCWG